MSASPTLDPNAARYVRGATDMTARLILGLVETLPCTRDADGRETISRTDAIREIHLARKLIDYLFPAPQEDEA